MSTVKGEIGELIGGLQPDEVDCIHNKRIYELNILRFFSTKSERRKRRINRSLNKYNQWTKTQRINDLKNRGFLTTISIKGGPSHTETVITAKGRKAILLGSVEFNPKWLDERRKAGLQPWGTIVAIITSITALVVAVCK